MVEQLGERELRSARAAYNQVMAKKYDKLQQLFEQGLKLDAGLDAVDNTALALFCANLDLDGIERMLTLGAQMSDKNKNGQTPLHLLVSVDFTGEATEWLLNIEGLESRGVDVDAATIGGVTPLMLAVKKGYLQVVCNLLNKKANPFKKDLLGREPLEYKVATNQ